jgi:hypothetical protein
MLEAVTKGHRAKHVHTQAMLDTLALVAAEVRPVVQFFEEFCGAARVGVLVLLVSLDMLVCMA